MLTDAFPFLLPEHVGTDLPESLRSLAGDLERIRLCTAPRPDERAHAPLITDWRTVLSPLGLRLMGSVTDRHDLASVGRRPRRTMDPNVEAFLSAWSRISRRRGPTAIGLRRRPLT
jgi:hypothetical protein